MQYPIGVTKSVEGLKMIIPDITDETFDVETYDSAPEMARKIIDRCFIARADDGELPPDPVSLDSLINNGNREVVWLYVDINTEPYLGRSAKLNVTLPNILRKRIDDVVSSNPTYKDRSHFLQLAASNELSGATLTPHFGGLIIKQGDIEVFIQNKDDFKFRVATKIGGTKVVSISYMWLSVTLHYKYLAQIEEFAGITYAEIIERYKSQQSS
ncbi:hypothetical protein CGT94_18605 [Vibrio metoecus]|uniref:type II toxin-antitoxin system HicB family antitoxin n=1 Tax=Vibrio metoecus TaxID=1481663 RepID=UPI000BA92C30|nr:type II toxin-antitoxin system HicB family antitoxin [Vibrio metoecus]PAR45108.1 hypothetical protein CGT94_18605 [Vibrio metoecus]